MKQLNNILLIAMLFSLWNCTSPVKEEPLPILGESKIDATSGDTIYHEIPEFTFVNQDSIIVTNADFDGKIYVADFFFTSCPTICPKVKKQMLRLYDRYEDNPHIVFLSHSIDVKRDTVGRLKRYADNLGISAPKWHMVTGDKDAIYEMAPEYMSIAIEDPDSPGGFDHSGWLILVDEARHIRSFCNGTKAEEVDRFMEDIDWLLAHPANAKTPR